MSSAPAISVVVPVYRAARYLSTAIDSILTQSFADFELILVFDRSDDGTEEILDRYSKVDRRVRVLENTGKKHVAGALNTGLSKSRGQFIARMDGDDIATPDRFAAQIAFLQQHPDIALCGTAADILDKDGNTIDRFTPTTGPERVRIAAEYAPPLFHPTWMMRQELPQLLGGYRDMQYAEDYDFQLRALDSGFKLDNIPMVGLGYRRDPGHRARLANHKAANYAYAMHRRRQHGLPDRFNPNSFKAAVAPRPGSITEALGQHCVARGFEMLDRNSSLAYVVLGAGLLLLPASAHLAWRRLRTAMALKLYGLKRA